MARESLLDQLQMAHYYANNGKDPVYVRAYVSPEGITLRQRFVDKKPSDENMKEENIVEITGKEKPVELARKLQDLIFGAVDRFRRYRLKRQMSENADKPLDIEKVTP